MLKLNNQKISSIYFNNQKINRYYFNGVMYEFYNPLINYDWSITTAKEYVTDGVELVTNGGFDTDSEWIKLNGAIISNSLYMQGSYSGVKQKIILENGTDYLVKIKINELINVNFRAYFNDSASVSTGWITTIGQKEFIITGSTDTTFINCSVGAGTNINCIIDNISVQKVIQQPNEAVSKNIGTGKAPLLWHSGNPLDFQGSQSVPVNIQNANISNITFGISANKRSPIFGRADQWQSYVAFSSSSVSLRLNTTMSFSYVLPLGEYVVLSFNIDKTNNTCTLLVNGNKIETVAITGAISGEILQLLSNMGSYFDGTINFITFSSNILTLAQSQQSYTNPNAFYNSMKNDANTLFCTDFGGNSGYIADDKNKVVGSNVVANGTFDIDTNWTKEGSWTIANGVASCNDGVGAYSYLTNTERPVIGIDYLVTFTISNYVSGNLVPRAGSKNGSMYSSNGTFSEIITPLDVEFFRLRSSPGFIGDIDNVSFAPISAVYPITNYSSTMRTNFQTEQSGLQELMIERDSLGFFLELRDYPKGNGVGYGDTQDKVAKNTQYEVVVDFTDGVIGDIIVGGNRDGDIILTNNFSSSNSFRAYIRADASWKTINSSLLIGKNHIVCHILENYMKLYINGSLVGTTSYFTTINSVDTLKLFKYINTYGKSKILLYKKHTEVQDILELYSKAQGLLQ